MVRVPVMHSGPNVTIVSGATTAMSLLTAASRWPAAGGYPTRLAAAVRGCRHRAASSGCAAAANRSAAWAAWRSGGGDVDLDRDAVGDDVVDGRAGPGLLDQVPQHLVRRVAGDLEAHPDALVAVAHLV